MTKIVLTPSRYSTKVEFTPIEFKCSICQKRASYGVNVKLTRGVIGQWFCKNHKPEDQK